ncbi:MAG: CYTH domain-containing protein [Firmicutes bacterium]|nr:CYTH domain-containing protein [Bacillota bacterium]
MEIEFKYHLDSEEVVDEILADEKVMAWKDADSYEELPMEAAYFDTADRRLNREGITFRVRREGRRIVGTLKWNGHSEDGMHEREEINVPHVGEESLVTPQVDIFRQSPMCETLKKIVGFRELQRTVTIRFLRRQVRIDTGKAICELSFDEGEVEYQGQKAPIREMEIELYSGSRQEMEKFGAYLAGKYDLQPENRSKFRQGIELRADK